jgi:hypothetical protein
MIIQYAHTVVALNIEYSAIFSAIFPLSLRFWRVQYTGVTNWNYPTAIKGTMNLARTSFGREILAGEIRSLVQYLAPLRYANDSRGS